jgi:hypothetical protein
MRLVAVAGWVDEWALHADQDQFLMLPRRSLCSTNQKYLKGAFHESQTNYTA